MKNSDLYPVGVDEDMLLPDEECSECAEKASYQCRECDLKFCNDCKYHDCFFGREYMLEEFK